MKAYIFELKLGKETVMKYNELESRQNCIEYFYMEDFEHWLNETDSIDNILFRIFY